MIIFGDRYELAFCKVGDKSWTALEGPCCPIDDTIFYKDQFYVVGEPGGTVAWDVSGPSPMVTEIAHLGKWIHTKKYLVELRGDLLLVVRRWHSPPDNRYVDDLLPDDCNVDDLPQPDDCYVDDLPQLDDCNVYDPPEPDDYYVYDLPPVTTARFKVFKLDWNTRRWNQVKCIGDYVLFLGGNQSMSLSARDFSECKGNHIDFCDDDWEMFVECKAWGNDLGIYNIKRGSFDRFYDKDSQIIMHPPIWVTPSVLNSDEMDEILERLSFRHLLSSK
ncbi:uncharacterized protein LOC131244082 [Magnolia sinica]|uniref:uncharacterized protein LOC131244082 n=1 Tax=Magnolia sinica TaxID=86752 RepID=UPI002659D9AF|nr:uncharacterized protein LOC131244082 [Magnolia sinica]